MARRDFREILAWALFAAVTAVHLHSRAQLELSRAQLELCTTQLEISRAGVRASTSFSTGEDIGPRDANLSDEPNGAAGFMGATPDIAHAGTASGAARYHPSPCAEQPCNLSPRSVAFRCRLFDRPHHCTTAAAASRLLAHTRRRCNARICHVSRGLPRPGDGLASIHRRCVGRHLPDHRRPDAHPSANSADDFFCSDQRR